MKSLLVFLRDSSQFNYEFNDNNEGNESLFLSCTFEFLNNLVSGYLGAYYHSDRTIKMELISTNWVRIYLTEILEFYDLDKHKIVYVYEKFINHEQ